MEDYTKFNTKMLDALISALNTIKLMQVATPSGPGTMSPTTQLQLEKEIAKLQKMSIDFKRMYKKFQAEQNKIIEQINSD